MDKRLAAEMANTEMAEHELHDAGWTFEFDRATRRFGACHFKTRRITLSAELVELNSEDEVMNTIRHEIAHVLAGSRAGHGPAWQRTAREIGCDAKRTHDAEVPEPPFIGRCPSCKREVRRSRRTKIACGECCRQLNGGKYDPQYLFTWERA